MSLQWTEHILNAEWVEGLADRLYPVPKPEIDVEKDRSKIRNRTTDHINIVDGGDESHNPMGLGYTHEAVTALVSIEIRTAARPPDQPDVERPGRVRFEGARDGNNCAEAYGGLKGEVKRILDLYRLGHREFDLIQATTWRDNSSMAGTNKYLGEWLVEFDQRAAEIDPPDPLGEQP